MSLSSLAVIGILALARTCLGQSSAYGQCGGQGWSGATTCTSGYEHEKYAPIRILILNAFIPESYSQCLPGTATVTPPPSSPTSAPGGGSTPSSTASATSGTATLLPNQLWIRADEEPNFHKYLRSQTEGSVGDAVIGPPTTAAQFNIASGQLMQFVDADTTLYAQVATALPTENRLKVFWSTTPATNVTWTFQGDAVNGVVANATQQDTGAFLACDDVSSDVPTVYLNLGAYDYMTPTGCADQTLNYYNGATAVD